MITRYNQCRVCKQWVDLRLWGEDSVEDILPPVFMLQQEDILDNGGQAGFRKGTIQTSFQKRSPFPLKRPLATHIPLNTETQHLLTYKHIQKLQWRHRRCSFWHDQSLITSELNWDFDWSYHHIGIHTDCSVLSLHLQSKQWVVIQKDSRQQYILLQNTLFGTVFLNQSTRFMTHLKPV